MKVMTFNIRGALYDDGDNHWCYRAALNVHTIQRYAPDLLGLQEAHLENLAFYRQHLAGYNIEQGYPYNNHEPYQYTSIIWNPNRLYLHESGGFWLSETPDVLSGSWETACFRSATWGLFEWLPTGQKFLHVNTHLDHISEFARQKGAHVIVEKTSHVCKTREVSKVVLTGDFNCMPASPTYDIFRSAGFMDTNPQDAPSASTFHGFQGSAYLPAPHEIDRIDWILLRGWDAESLVETVQIIYDAKPPLYPSDHYPVMVVLSNYSDPHPWPFPFQV